MPKLRINDINNSIHDKIKPAIDNRQLLLGESIYNNYLYQMFVLEFINYINKEKNVSVRKKIRELIEKINFKTEFNKFIEIFKELSKNFSENDITLLNTQISSSNYIQANKHKIYDQMDNVRYDFDNITINKLKILPKNEIISELNKIMEHIIVIKDIFSKDNDINNINISNNIYPNVYIPCGRDTNSIHCYDGKLVIKSKEILDKNIDILANDILNPIKEKYLTSGLFVENIIDYFKFNQYPNEIISITEIVY